MTRLVAAALLALSPLGAAAQPLTQRGLVEARTVAFPQEATNDPTQLVFDVLAREEVFLKPSAWIQFAAGVDLRANSHVQIEDAWSIDEVFRDRGVRRPRAAVRRLAATLARGRWTVDLGKQFVRWGKTDIVTPTDRFAPRDFLNVLDAEFLAVTGVRASIRLGSGGSETLEGVWIPRPTPSRLPLLDQRWTVTSPAVATFRIRDDGSDLPEKMQIGVRWNHVGDRLELALSVFDGINHLPNIRVRLTPIPEAIAVTRAYPEIRAYGADAAAPTRWFTLKGEAAYFTSSTPITDEYALYVVQVERQSGEWVFVGGYAGEVVTKRRAPFTFAPDRGLTRSLVGRASLTIDPRRSIAFEAAVRQNGDGVYAKTEYSEARGQHWRVTISGIAIAGQQDDFLGQYRRNSHVAMSLRYSF